MLEVKRIDSKDTYDFIMKKHYLQRKPQISIAYGLFINNKLEGCITIGKPASNSLCEGLFGKEYKSFVYELNRMVVNDNLPRNTLSKFLSLVLKDLKDTNIVLVSYADSGMNHHGYIYQATNWIYTGQTKSRTDKYTQGTHSRHYDKNIDNTLRKVRTSKYRYIYIPNKKIRKQLLKKLNYDILPYPKGDNERYILGEKMKTKIINTKTGEEFYE